MSEKINNNSCKDNYLMNIRSKYILKQIMENLKTKISLKIINYNKNLQNKLNIDINNYRKYLAIELEIDVVPGNYGQFINIYNDKEESYYHIYFNDNKEEIKRK